MADFSPNLFMNAVLGYQQTAAIKAALELDLFSEIENGNGTTEALAGTTGAAVRTSAYFAITLRPGAISKSKVTSTGSLNLRPHSWTEAPLPGWAASSSIWPRPR
jgi:hypothetical protein